MVSQIRPGLVAGGQFPGAAARAAPTQLSTPLVAPRRASSPPKSAPIPVSAPIPAAADLFGAVGHQQSAYASPDPFGSLSAPAPPFQMQAAVPVPRVERAAADSLFGAPSAATPPGRVSQQGGPYNSLFGSPERVAAPNSAPPVRRSSQSFSYGQNAGGAPPPPQKQVAAVPLRQFGQQPPPPAAPFLGYADGNNARTQSYRAVGAAPATTPPTSTGSRTSLSPSTRPGIPQYPGSGSSLPAPSPPRGQSAVASSDELLDAFLATPLDAHFRDPRNPAASDPPASKLLLADIPDTVHSLESLYKQRRWRSLTKKALAMLQSPVSDPATTLAIKSWWLAGLIKDGHFDNAASVLDQLGDLDDFATANAAAGEPTQMRLFVPIRLRLLEALLSKCKGNLALHEKQLFQLTTKLRLAIEDDITMDVLGVQADVAARWLRITQFALINHLIQQHKFALALRVCSKIELERLALDEKIVVLSRFGRINLQMGDLSTADKMFSLARICAELLKSSRPVPTDQEANQMAQLESRLLLNDGMLFFAQNKLQEALSAFDGVLDSEARRVTDFYPEPSASPGPQDEALFLEEDLICAAVNNYAICALYCCDVKGAVAALERMVRSNPTRFLNGVVVFNLSSLYDLVYDNTNSAARKEMMKKLADLYDLEHIDPAAFRI